jgi:tetratricopeptide (TPR) repeat protein
LEPQPPNTIIFFCSYAHEDEELRKELEKHLKILERLNLISVWLDRKIGEGGEWKKEIDEQLESADVILLLISPDFIASDYCYDIEMKRAMDRHDAGEAVVIPVFLRPVIWKGAPFGKLNALPTDARPVTSWPDRDEAFVIVSEGIQRAVETLYVKRQANQSTTAGKRQSSAPIPRPPVVGFVARRDEQGHDIVERLKEELAQQGSQLITLSGPGGIGKTTLAAEAARALRETFQGRIVWSSAEKRTDFTLSTLLDDISTQLGRTDLRTLAPDLKEAQVRALVDDPPALVVLDNYETIAPDVKKIIEQWFTLAQCSALFTSRHRINSTRNITIAAMSREEAEEYLKRLVAETQDTQIFSDGVRQRIYETAEANPFVMQWVVAQIDTAQEPDTVLEELEHGEGDAAERVFDRSFHLLQLGDDGRAALLALSLFVPSATRDALAEVAGFSDDLKRVNEAVKNLRALWLVKGVDENRRLTIEGLTRTLAHARLSKDERADEFRQRFVAHFLNYTEAHAQPTPEDFDALEAEKDNVLGAIDIAFDMRDWDTVLRVADVLGSINAFLDLRGYWDEAIKYNYKAIVSARFVGREHDAAVLSHRIGIIQSLRGLYEEARQANEDALAAYRNLKSERNVAVALHELGRLAQDQGELAEARRLYDESLEIKKKLGDQSGIASTLHELGRLAHAQDELTDARRLYNESLEIEKKLGNQSGIAISLHSLAMLAQDQGELTDARRLYDESLEISKKLGNQSSIASSLHQLGVLAQDQGELAEARRLYDESLEISKKLGDQSGIAITLHQLARLAQDQGELAEARRLYNESLKISKKLGNQSGIAISLHQLARLAQDQGELAEARRLYNESLEISKKLSNQSGIAISLHQLARLAQDQGELAEARRLYDESLEISKKLGDQSGIANTLGQLGLLAEEEGNREDAVRLTREALSIFEKLKSPYAEIARRVLKRLGAEGS